MSFIRSAYYLLFIDIKTLFQVLPVRVYKTLDLKSKRRFDEVGDSFERETPLGLASCKKVCVGLKA
ncbi:hypothetical protein D104_17955 [Marinomonas profundimaris]|uniref:Uncharacterized protein n=1 Tax=Marinomonas profundimaris TaxID=1208321 RepID=W1RNR1_9GAMM|nr:hypothetical protein D104_17955 [Marinomonas profundimaris]